jgi:hypothetical protein
MHVSLLFVLLAAAGEVSGAFAFEPGLPGWERYPEDLKVVMVSDNAGNGARIEVEEGMPLDYYQIIAPAPLTPGGRASVSVSVFAGEMRDGRGALLSLAFFDKEEKRIGCCESCLPPALSGHHLLRVRGIVPEKAASSKIHLILHGRGEVTFRNLQLQHTPPPERASMEKGVTLRVTEEKACESLEGFGAEDDGWFFNAENREAGADEEGIALREKRLAWMQPDYMRMFFWYNDWNPSLDGKTFTWDSDNMASHYRSLVPYQRMGTRVNVCCVEWGKEAVWKDIDRMAAIVGALMEHLIREKGFSCIRDWTMTNEPNLHYARLGHDFEHYAAIHRRMTAEFEERGLDLRITASDDGMGQAWFDACVSHDDLFERSGLYASHCYLLPQEKPVFQAIVEDRVAALAARQPRKPFIIAEFGIQDSRFKPPLTNPFMEEYPYAVACQAAYIDGLNGGAAGFVIWCLQEMYYPGAKIPMNFGLWHFGDRGWKLRPVFHTVAGFCRHTDPGDVVWKCISTHPGRVKGVRAGDTLFWVNRTQQPARVSVENYTVKRVRIFTEDTLDGLETAGLRIEAEDNAFTAPPMSFGQAFP